ncbi:sugar nucleotide-binding protein [Candidatus Microgenomates bacterium]|nr:sugar nucleotide-binding protein [Candidatus Microgenomates bacterium]
MQERTIKENKEFESSPKLLVIGGSGLVGGALVSRISENGQLVLAPTHQEFDIAELSIGEIAKKINGTDVVINLAAQTEVDVCEKEKGDFGGMVWKTNVVGVEKLAKACLAGDATLVHISSDYVLSGSEQLCPHKETEKIDPITSWYAKSKAEAEKILLSSRVKAHIVRVQRPFGDDFNIKRRDFLRNVYEANRLGKKFFAIADQKLTPGYVKDYAKAILAIAGSQHYGIWHVATPTVTTIYDAVCLGLKYLEQNHHQIIDWNLIKATTFDEFMSHAGAPRPKDTAFDVSKFERHFGQGILRPLPEMLADWAANIALYEQI